MSSTKREEIARKKAEDEARKAGTLPAETDEHGNAINPHIPEFMKVAPWYAGTKTGLDHQRLPENKKYSTDINAGWYERGKTARQQVTTDSNSSTKHYSKGACTNCGATTHEAKYCLEKPKKIGAAKIGERLAADDTIQPDLHLSYDGKRDTYNGYNADSHLKAIEKRKLIQSQKPEETEEEKAAIKKKTDFVLPKTSLRDRNDTAKYLRNLDPESAFYDPKTRSMRANPTPHLSTDQTTFAGDNFIRNTGDAIGLEQMEEFASLRSSTDNNSVDALQSNPTSLALAKKEFELKKERLAFEKKKRIEEQYGSLSASNIKRPEEMIVASSSAYSEWAPDGKIIKGVEILAPSSCYEEDIMEGNHTKIWGSYFDTGIMSWGYGCCWQTVRNSFCTGENGKKAAQESKARAASVINMERKPEVVPISSSSSSIPPSSSLNKANELYGEGSTDAKFDQKKLEKALQEGRKRREKHENDSSSSSSSSNWSSSSSSEEERSERRKKSKKKSKKHAKKKHKHSKKSRDKQESHETTPEEIEAYRLTRIREGDPLANFH